MQIKSMDIPRWIVVSEPDPRIIKRWVMVNRLGWKCTLRLVCRHTSIGFWLVFWCALIRNANRTRAVFVFCFVLECCETKRVRLKRFCGCQVLQKALLHGYRSKVQQSTNIPQCILPSRPVCQTLYFDFFEGLVLRLGGSRSRVQTKEWALGLIL